MITMGLGLKVTSQPGFQWLIAGVSLSSSHKYRGDHSEGTCNLSQTKHLKYKIAGFVPAQALPALRLESLHFFCIIGT